MNTQNVNVKTAAQESSKRWGKFISRAIDRGWYNVALAEEAAAHYGEKFTRRDVWFYFITGVVEEFQHAYTLRRKKRK